MSATNVSVFDDRKIVPHVSGLKELFSVTRKQDVASFDLYANEKKKKSLDVHVLKGGNCMRGKLLTQDRRYTCNIDQARFGKEIQTCINSFEEKATYANGRNHVRSDLFASVNKIKRRDIFLFIPLPRKLKYINCMRCTSRIRDMLSLRGCGWGPPSPGEVVPTMES